MSDMIEVEPQPRIDVLVTDAATGAQRRRTTYCGTVWFGGTRPQVTGMGVITRSQPAMVQSPWYLPDSLPYRVDAAGSALVAVTVAIQSAPDEAHQVIAYRAGLEVDPRNPAVAWLQVQVQAAIRMPTAVSYRVEVVVPPDAVLAGP